ncbi:ATP-dependent helicase [Acetobacter fallax]|uniref:ATP-dependent helicase n=1 Tax=Acetobacter fallax TaxID=1737473 RepID=A0ABX0KE03_9PROT|nr:ATP-dependent helicase [Acetobacter fallax]NHO34043.1 ATP-dependent helicase [Acetobacter fallax]NHO37577.1 ATP-dependent helicase [Acetobacter fallax]
MSRTHQPDLSKSSAAKNSLVSFAPPTCAWFSKTFSTPTAVQSAAWTEIRKGGCVLVIAPTGSGKTLAAFLLAIDRLFSAGETKATGRPEKTVAKTASARPGTKILYISPIKALGADVQRNLRIPLDGVGMERGQRGDPSVRITVGMRTGDTSGPERAALVRRPPDILITTPESLYLMLTSNARETLREVTTVIIDEIHAVAGTKRGSHLALSLERLDRLLERPAQRIGLSATVRPVDRVAGFLGGAQAVTVVSPGSDRRLELRIIVPVEDMSDIPATGGAADGPGQPGQVGSIWPHVTAHILDQVLARRSTIVFVNSRGLAEKLTARLNELYAERCAEQVPELVTESTHHDSWSGGTQGRSAGVAPLIARSHHGSVSKEQRAEIEAALKSGELRCVVATSSLELGIDMGLVDLVVQVGAPPSVASGLQRVGRAGHQVGGVSTGLIYPRSRRDLIDATVTAQCMLKGELEAMVPPCNPLDVLAQQTVAAVAMDTIGVEDWYATVRRSWPFRELSRKAFGATLEMLAGQYPSDAFSEFRPRLVWDRKENTLTARPGAKQLAVISGGTIPDRGMYSVMLPEGEEKAGARRVGELDEEMVYESRVNDVITLGATSWRIQQITNDQVIVVPAPGRSARLPFWRGDGPGRPAELGRAIGRFLRELDTRIADRTIEEASVQLLDTELKTLGLDVNAATNIVRYVVEQHEATGVLPTDKTLVIERCRDETGDWRVILHSPYGRRVHAAWALAVAERAREHFGTDPSVVASDDGIVARIPDTDGRVPGRELFLFDPDMLRSLLTTMVGGSALFASRFRECAARALLLPRRTPGKRSPLWQQRLRTAQLLQVAQEHRDFPILVEAARECLQDVYDLDALHDLMRELRDGGVRLAEVTTDIPSPFAATMLFGYVAEFMYAGDAPLAERRASVLSLDTGLLDDLLGQVDFSEILDPDVVERVGQELQRTLPDRRVSSAEGVVDLLRELGPMTLAGILRRVAEAETDAVRDYLARLEQAARVIPVEIAGDKHWAIIEDAGRLRDALGVRLPDGIPAVFLRASGDALRDLVARYARTHAPFTTGAVAAHFGLGAIVAEGALEELRDRSLVLTGSFGIERRSEEQASSPVAETPVAKHEWVSEDVFRRLRLRSLRAAREATRPVSPFVYARLVPERHYLTGGDPASGGPVPGHGGLEGTEGVIRVVEQLAGLPLPASLWEMHIFPVRVRDYVPAMLDGLLASGDVIWVGHEVIGENDGLVSLHLRDIAGQTLPARPSVSPEELPPLQARILHIMADGGAFFVRQLWDLMQQDAGTVAASDVRAALWSLVWMGCVSTDTFAPLRVLTGSRKPRGERAAPARRPYSGIWAPASRLRAPGSFLRGSSTQDDVMMPGRWSLVPLEPCTDTVRGLALVERFLDRYGIVTRGAAVAEAVSGGFPALQPLLRGMEDAGHILRGRFVEGLGGAQFADRDTIDRLRDLAAASPAEPVVLALSALDPACLYGAILPWPAHPTGVKPTRRKGAIVVLCDGRLMVFLPPGRRMMLTYFDQDDPGYPAQIMASVAALAAALKREKRAMFTLETIDGEPATRSPAANSLRQAGFSSLPKGLGWRG